MGFGPNYSTATVGCQGWAPAQVTAPHRRAVKEHQRAENHSQIAAPLRRAMKDGLRPGMRHCSGGLRRNADWPKTYRPSVTRAGEESERTQFAWSRSQGCGSGWTIGRAFGSLSWRPRYQGTGPPACREACRTRTVKRSICVMNECVTMQRTERIACERLVCAYGTSPLRIGKDDTCVAGVN